MANGTMIEVGTHNQQDRFISYLALDGQAAVQATWEWMDVKGYGGRGSLDISGIGTGAIDVRMSNALLKPASNDAGQLVGSPFSSDGGIDIAIASRWLVVRKTVLGDSTATTVRLHKTAQG